MTEKQCSSCQLKMPIEMFHLNSQSPDGLAYYCKPCQAMKAKAALAKAKTREIKVTEKKCGTCGETKRFDSFDRYARSLDGLANKCKVCRRRERQSHRVARKYGLEPGDIEDLMLEQGHACAICEQDFKGLRAVVDHNHDTGVVRGILCDQCNKGIGMLGDSPTRLQSAQDYLSTRGYYGP